MGIEEFRNSSSFDLESIFLTVFTKANAIPIKKDFQVSSLRKLGFDQL